MTDHKRLSLVKPTLETRFHIDFDWWSKNDNDWRVHLRGNLCEMHQQSFASLDAQEQVDWVDPQTAEVQRVDGLQQVLISHCARQEEFITSHSTLVDAAFRLFLANGNTPLSAVELGERLNRQPQIILKTLAGGQVYRGLRPCQK
ncbi:MAG: hypothetical protein L0Z70_11010 [Chloroflexi bacterium]|nr:hypothetical protein [Chloroflexota bacterium]